MQKKEIGYYAVRMEIEKTYYIYFYGISMKYSYIFIVSSIKLHSPNWIHKFIKLSMHMIKKEEKYL